MAYFHLIKSLLLHHYHTIVVAILFIYATTGASLSFSFDFSKGNYASELNYSNDAYWAKPVIELTNHAINDSVGRVWYAWPVPLWDRTTRELASFNTNFSFQIKSNSSIRGDGMAFLLSYYPSVTPADSGGGNLGLLSRASAGSRDARERFVAVEFDTFRNIFENSRDHVGIDINAIVSNASKDTVGSGKNLSSDVPMTARVTYNNNTTLLSVDLQIGDAPYHISTYVDLRDYLPRLVAVGFSAATSRYVERHQLLAWSFNSSDLDVAPQTHDKARRTGLIIGLIIVLSGLLVLILVAARIRIRVSLPH